MEKDTEQISIKLVNNTSETQSINLFDQSDPTSGGAFSPSTQSEIDYDLSSETFPLETLVTFLKNTSPLIDTDYIFENPNYLTMIGLLAWLNGLGHGTFTEGTDQLIKCNPNYPVSESEPGAILYISTVFLITIKFNVLASNIVGGNCEFQNSGVFEYGVPTDSNQNISESSNTATLFPTGILSVNGNATGNYTINLLKNNVLLYTNSGGIGSVSYLTPNYSLTAGDILEVDLLGGMVTFEVDATQTTLYTGTAACSLNDSVTPANDVTLNLVENTVVSQANIPLSTGFKSISVSGNNTGTNYTIGLYVNGILWVSGNGASGNWSFNVPDINTFVVLKNGDVVKLVITGN